MLGVYWLLYCVTQINFNNFHLALDLHWYREINASGNPNTTHGEIKFLTPNTTNSAGLFQKAFHSQLKIFSLQAMAPLTLGRSTSMEWREILSTNSPCSSTTWWALTATGARVATTARATATPSLTTTGTEPTASTCRTGSGSTRPSSKRCTI